MLIDNTVYKRLADEESKYWYDARIEFAFHQDRFKFCEKIYETNPTFYGCDVEWLDAECYQGKKFIVYGTGKVARHDYYILSHSKLADRLVAFADTFAHGGGTKYLGFPVLTPMELCKDYLDHIVIVGSMDYADEIYRQLARMGFPQENIYYPPWQRMMASMSGKQYFDVFVPDGTENFIDAGCYDGQSTLDFLEWCNGSYNMIWAFEASPIRIPICRKVLQEHRVTYELIEGAVYSSQGTINFSGNAMQNVFGGAGWQERPDGHSISVRSITIDDVVAKSAQKPTFIKMDVEGCELEALKGAKETIQTYRPKLAISMYHRISDIVDLPSYILSLVPNYKLYIRHYLSDIQETVLYAQ